MSLFEKKKEETTSYYGENRDTGSIAKEAHAKAGGASVKILGSGCPKCNQLEAATKEALQQLGMDTAIDHVTDFSEIAAYGVMATPALVVDGKVVSYGKVLKTKEVVEILQKVRS
jgi:small redox-active disulfide protein 2